MIIQLNVTNESKPLSKEFEDLIWEQSDNGIELIPKKNDLPIPWDAVCYIEDGFLILDGDMGQQGSHRGWAKMGIPLDRVQNYVDVNITISDEEQAAVIKDQFIQHGWLKED